MMQQFLVNCEIERREKEREHALLELIESLLRRPKE
jgi:hypothetical protein